MGMRRGGDSRWPQREARAGPIYRNEAAPRVSGERRADHVRSAGIIRYNLGIAEKRCLDIEGSKVPGLAHLAHFKCPTSVDFVPELPRTAPGKLQKFRLREKYWKGTQRRVN